MIKFTTETYRPYIIWYVTCDEDGSEILKCKKVMATSKEHAMDLVGPAAEG